MKQPENISMDDVRHEIDRIDAQINRLQAQRDALMRLVRRFNSGAEHHNEPPVSSVTRKRGLTKEVLRYVDESRPKGIRTGDAVATFGADWSDGSIRTALSYLAKIGSIRREGEWFKSTR